MAQHYRCAACFEEFTSKDVEVDHIIGIGSVETWDQFVDNLFCEQDNLQCVCKPCHKAKTLKERQNK